MRINIVHFSFTFLNLKIVSRMITWLNICYNMAATALRWITILIIPDRFNLVDCFFAKFVPLIMIN